MGWHSVEYTEYIKSPEWKEKSRRCRQLTQNRCCLFPWRRSRYCHHMNYSHLKNEIPIRDTVGLSITAHQIVHLEFLWKSPLRKAVNV